MKNKILYLVMIVVIVIGTIIISARGFNFDINYKKTKMIEIYVGKEFNLNDIKSITDEVLEGKEVRLNKIGEFENTISIKLEEISDEEFDLLIQKVNEKYELENTKEDILSVDLSHTRLRDIVRPYIMPVIIISILTLIYFILIYKKVGIMNLIVKYFLNVVLPVLTVISLIAILGIPIAVYTMAVLVVIYSILLIVYSYNTKMKFDKIKLEEAKK